MYAMKKSIF